MKKKNDKKQSAPHVITYRAAKKALEASLEKQEKGEHEASRVDRNLLSSRNGSKNTCNIIILAP
jgi:hypothetical protein